MTLPFGSINKMRDVIKENSTNTTFFYLLFLIAIILLSFVLYIVIFASPSGTDVYSHMFNTQNMAGSNSLSEFYDKSLNLEYSGSDYPFGLWYFGSITMKVTGFDVYTIAYIIPLILLFIILGIYFCYAFTMTASTNQSLLSLIFLVSMTQLSLNLLNYSTSTFVMPILITIFFLSLRDIEWKNILLMSVLLFTLCFTHTGTFLFLTIFAVTYVLLRALIWGKFDYNFYLVIVALLICFVTAVSLFPFIQAQYIDKGRLIITTTYSISSVTKLVIIKDAGQIFYDTIFVGNNYVFALLWAALLFVAGKFLVFIHFGIKNRFSKKNTLATMPFIGSITTVSKGIIMTPFWIGPLQTLFSVIGIFKLDERGKCIALTLFFSSLLPGYLMGSEGTGSVRETFYLFLLIPITAALGFYYFYPLINRITQSGIRRAFVIGIYVIIFVPLIAVPVIACLHYEIPITMTKEENINLVWLGSIGNPLEGAAGAGYRDRMTMYGNKTVPSIPSGTETKRFSKSLSAAYFTNNAEYSARDLSSYQIQYLISSDRVLKDSGLQRSAIKLDTNKQVDKIYASGDFFGFYKIMPQPKIPTMDLNESLTWDAQQPAAQIQDVGSLFLFENPAYKIKVSDTSPRIQYFGTPTKNMLGEGDFVDSIGLSYGIAGTYIPQYDVYDLGELTYTDIQRSGNEIVYKTTLMNPSNTERIASLSVKYIFNDLAVKREITVTNDLENVNRSSILKLYVLSTIFSPMTDFEFHLINPEEKEWESRTIYPSQDKIVLKDKIVDRIFFNYGTTGIYVLYDGSADFPNNIWYAGAIDYDYGYVSLGSEHTIQPSEATTIGQYFSVNNKITAMKNAETYSSIAPYPFPDAQIPIVITGHTSGTNLTADEKTALTMLKQYEIPYAMIVPASTPSGTIKLPGIVPSGDFSQCYYDNYEIHCKNLTVQQKELKLLKQKTNATGILISDFSYNLNTIKSLSENQYTYAEVLEGVRNPKIAYLEGEDTGIVLMPVSQPDSRVLYHRYETDAIFSQWNATINSGGGVATFLWDLSEIGNPEFTDQFDSLINYSKSRGMTFTTPDAIARHYKNLEPVLVNVTRGEEYVILHARNTAGKPVSGITYRLIMPLIENTCPYIITNGTIVRAPINQGTCRVYASFSLDPFESKEIKIETGRPLKQLFPQVPELYQGQNTIRIVDENNKTVKQAGVYVDLQYYESDTQGEVKFSVNYGDRTIKIIKAGYNTVTIKTYVQPVFYRYLSIFRIK